MVDVYVRMGKVFLRKGEQKVFSRDAQTRDPRVKWFPLLDTRVGEPQHVTQRNEYLKNAAEYCILRHQVARYITNFETIPVPETLEGSQVAPKLAPIKALSPLRSCLLVELTFWLTSGLHLLRVLFSFVGENRVLLPLAGEKTNEQGAPPSL